MSQLSPFVGAPQAAEPYRVDRRAPQETAEPNRVEAPVVAAILLFWAVSVVRVAGAIAYHEVFGGEATLALMVAVAAPCAAWWAYRSARLATTGGGSPGSR